MFVRGCNPNIHTFTSLLKGFLSQERMIEAYALWDGMIKEGVLPNVVTYNTLINGLCSVGNMGKTGCLF